MSEIRLNIGSLWDIKSNVKADINSINWYIANIENAHRDIPLSRIRLIAKALGVEPYELLKF